jgi:hypothetical protein
MKLASEIERRGSAEGTLRQERLLEGSRRASIVLPEPGGPTSKTLWSERPQTLAVPLRGMTLPVLQAPSLHRSREQESALDERHPLRTEVDRLLCGLPPCDAPKAAWIMRVRKEPATRAARPFWSKSWIASSTV